MLVNPNDDQQRADFERRISLELELGGSGLARATSMIQATLETRAGRDYLEQRLGAQAFTAGTSIRLAQTDDDAANLVAHELAHVVQQRGSGR